MVLITAALTFFIHHAQGMTNDASLAYKDVILNAFNSGQAHVISPNKIRLVNGDQVLKFERSEYFVLADLNDDPIATFYDDQEIAELFTNATEQQPAAAPEQVALAQHNAIRLTAFLGDEYLSCAIKLSSGEDNQEIFSRILPDRATVELNSLEAGIPYILKIDGTEFRILISPTVRQSHLDYKTNTLHIKPSANIVIFKEKYQISFRVADDIPFLNLS